ncbi:MAG: ABC transporter ATP-binding protein [Balneolaceae bacterium]|nr:ABC transporter ATP-binding protein [Balneolaceae bacterium]MBO6545799.1 ABC transporter ATP-binding protein [Balneolaceae bacterium]MBO6647195.1 ABC transporter ATP-binding protein [Balneolaceae bacterium]
MIEIKNLTKSFGDNLIWEDVSFQIEDGETLAIIGKSGCGKSVMLKHLNALLYPDSGKIYIDGSDLFCLSYSELRKMRQRFGILFQGAALFDSISTFENIAFPLRYFTDQSEDEIRANVEEALEMVNLVGAGDKPTSSLSGGMRKRVGVARAIILKPQYLLYDEPTSGLDPQTSEEINELIVHMADSLDITSVVITHDMHSVLTIAEKVAFLDEQKLSWFGTVEELQDSDYEPLVEFTTASEYQITKSQTF